MPIDKCENIDIIYVNQYFISLNINPKRVLPLCGRLFLFNIYKLWRFFLVCLEADGTEDKMTNNYRKAMSLYKRGLAEKHFTYSKTGCLMIDLGGSWVGYILPRDAYVDVAENNVHVGHGDIDLDRLMVVDVSHRPDYDRVIEKWD